MNLCSNKECPDRVVGVQIGTNNELYYCDNLKHFDSSCPICEEISMKNPYHHPKPEGYFEIGIVELDGLVSGEWTVDTMYDNSKTANKRIQFMAYELMRARGYCQEEKDA